jgi:hypothetical protein
LDTCPIFAKVAVLNAICPEAWQKVTGFVSINEVTASDDVTEKVTPVTFSEYLLRPILNLTPEQQLELVSDLADGTIDKGRGGTGLRTQPLDKWLSIIYTYRQVTR